MSMSATRARPRAARHILVAVLVAALLAVGLAVPAATPASASLFDDPITQDDLIDLATYQINATVEPAGAPAVTTHIDAVMGIDNFIDVSVPTDGVPDLRVTVVPDVANSQVVLGAERLTTGTLPLRLEYEFDLPGPSDRAIVLGYDSTDSSAPTGYLLGVAFSGTGDLTRIQGSVGTAGATAPLSLIGSIFGRNGTTRIDPFDANVRFDAPGTTLGVVFESQPSTGHTHVDLSSTIPSRATVDLSDLKDGRSRSLHAVVQSLPTGAAIDLVHDGAGNTTASFTSTSAISQVDVSLHEQQGNRVTDVVASLAKLPTQATLSLHAGNPATGGTQEAHYTASSPIGSIVATATTTINGAIASQAVVDANTLPTVVDLVRGPDGHLALSTNGQASRLEAGLAFGRSVALLPDTGHYLNAIRGADGTVSVAAQVLGLQSVTASLGDPFEVKGALGSAPLHAVLSDPDRSINVTTTNTPASIDISVSPSAGELSYQANAGLSSLTATLDTTVPFVATAKHGELTLTTVPSNLDLEFGLLTAPTTSAAVGAVTRSLCVPTVNEDCPDPEPPPDDEPVPPPPPPADQDLDLRVGLDANGATIGRIDALLTSGGLPAGALASTEDGVVLQRTSTVFRLQGRVSGLRFAEAHVQVIDDANTPLKRITRRGEFELHLDPVVVQTRPARLRFLSDGNAGTVSLSRLPGDVDNLSLFETTRLASLGIPEASTQRVDYDASGPIARADINLDLVSMPNPLTATLLNVPAHVDVCKSTDGVCNDEPGPDRARDHGSFSFHGSSNVTVTAFLCLLPSTGTCDDEAEADSALELQNVALRHLGFEYNEGNLTAANPLSAALDTDGFPVSGDIELFGEDTDVDLSLPGDSFLGSDNHAKGIDIQNSPALNTIGVQLSAWKTGTFSATVQIDGHVACNANTTWQLITPTIFVPNPFFDDIICG